MPIFKFMKIIIAAFVLVWLAACSATGSSTDSAAHDAASSGTDSSASSVAAGEAEALKRARMQAEQVEREMLAITTFYFAFDKADLGSEARDALIYHARRLNANSSLTVRLEGHADERGTREYNLALGEKRANTVESYLLVQGVSRAQIETVSYGEEKPINPGQSETAYSKNRRVDMR